MRESTDVRDAAAWADRVRAAGLSVGLVPTMGALHEGHYALVERARAECDRVAVTIFVNPTQFDSSEDLDTYPSTLEEDTAGCRERGVDFLLVARSTGAGGVYADDFQTWVAVQELSQPLCGRFRHGHFRGVATVVALFFGIFRPHRAYFGLKDFQQARLIEKMAEDLRTGVEVRALPTVREPDGLAMSSRNRRLAPDARQDALALSRALDAARRAFEDGEDRPSRLEEIARDVLARAPGVEVQYLEVLDAETLRAPASSVDGCARGVVLAVAAHVGGVRLIDNIQLRR